MGGLEPIRIVVGRLFRMLLEGRLTLTEYERRIREAEDVQQSLELGIGAATEARRTA